MEPQTPHSEADSTPEATSEQWLRGTSWASLALLVLVTLLQLLCVISALTGPIENRINLMGVFVLLPFALGLGAFTLILEYSVERPRPAFRAFCWTMLAGQLIFFLFG